MSDRGRTRYMQRLYNLLSRWYDSLFDAIYRGRDEAWRAACLEELCAADSVLEIGAGTGRTEQLCTRPLDRYVSVDISRQMLSRGSHSQPIQGDAHSLPFQSEQFDAILGTLVMSTQINQENVLREMKRVKQKGGKIVLIDKFSEQQSHKRFLDRVKTKLSWPLAFDFDVDIETLARRSGLAVIDRTAVPQNMGMIERVVLQ